MSSAFLFWTYLTVMIVALGLFVLAFRARFDTPRHRRLGTGGVLLAIAGIVAVLLADRLLGWQVSIRFENVVWVHRRLAYLSTALLLLLGVSGWLRWPVHTRLFRYFFPAYIATLTLAVVGYRP